MTSSVGCELRFSRRALREAIDWGDTQLKIHLARLVELEYLVAHRLPKTGGHEYELVYDVADGQSALCFPGLADIEAIKQAHDGHAYDSAWSGQNDPRSAPGRGLVGPRSGGGRAGESAAESAAMRVGGDVAGEDSKTHVSAPTRQPVSYPQPLVAAAAAGA